MTKKLLVLSVFIVVFFLAIPNNVYACSGPGDCPAGEYCNTSNPPGECQSVLGHISPPQAISNIGYGSQGIGHFLSQLIQLLYVAAAIVFVFMILWSAFQWIMSAGDKEKLNAVRSRMIHAIIGIALLAAAFVIIRFFGQVTGFHFFQGQENPDFSLPTPTPCLMFVPGAGQLTPQPCS